MQEACVIVSASEEGSGVVELLRKLGVPLRFDGGATCDYAVGAVRIERLTIEEFERAAAEGRLSELVEKLAGSGEPIIVVEGCTKTARRGLVEAAATLALKGATFLISSGPEETAHIVYAFYRRAAARRRRSYLPPSKIARRGSNSLAEVQISLLTAVPGIGRENARKLLQHFKTPRRVLTASFHELAKVVGRARARRLTDALDTIYPEALGEGSLSHGGSERGS